MREFGAEFAEYFIENAPDAIDLPGEWRLDQKTGLVTAMFKKEENPNAMEIVVPRLQELVEFKGDITGKWKLSFTSPEGPEESTADLVMASDGTITGTLTSKRGTASILSGYLSADKFNFVINISIGPSFADVRFNGTFDGTSLKGTINVQDISIDFTGVRPTNNNSLAENSSMLQGDVR